jgi:hypothetical protein
MSNKNQFYYFFRSILQGQPDRERPVVLKLIRRHMKGEIKTRDMLDFMDVFCGKENVVCAFKFAKTMYAKDKENRQRITKDNDKSVTLPKVDRRMTTRKIVTFPSLSACKCCMNYEATHILPNCKCGKTTVCYACFEFDPTQVCLRCEDTK